MDRPRRRIVREDDLISAFRSDNITPFGCPPVANRKTAASFPHIFCEHSVQLVHSIRGRQKRCDMLFEELAEFAVKTARGRQQHTALIIAIASMQLTPATRNVLARPFAQPWT